MLNHSTNQCCICHLFLARLRVQGVIYIFLTIFFVCSYPFLFYPRIIHLAKCGDFVVNEKYVLIPHKHTIYTLVDWFAYAFHIWYFINLFDTLHTTISIKKKRIKKNPFTTKEIHICVIKSWKLVSAKINIHFETNKETHSLPLEIWNPISFHRIIFWSNILRANCIIESWTNILNWLFIWFNFKMLTCFEIIIKCFIQYDVIIQFYVYVMMKGELRVQKWSEKEVKGD